MINLKRKKQPYKKFLKKQRRSSNMDKKKKCTAKTEVYSRVVGFFRPVQEWNDGKKEEYKERKEYNIGNSYSDKK
jgi:anaerobic ribonucleoside-triphosphate reductase